jgi:hypothetical protein
MNKLICGDNLEELAKFPKERAVGSPMKKLHTANIKMQK